MMNIFPLFRDGAVLPHGRKLPVWGEAFPGSEVTLTAGDMKWSCEADTNGRWQLELPPFAPCVGMTFRLSDGHETAEYRDIAFGEVFLLSGQSNMKLEVARCKDAMPPTFEGAENSRIRELRVGILPSFDEDNTEWPPGSVWKSLKPETLESFGALGLAFAGAFAEESDMPIGLVNCAEGGTRIESWLPPEDLADAPKLTAEFAEFRDPARREAADRALEERTDAWMKQALAAEPPEDGWEFFAYDVFPDMLYETKYKDFHGVLWLRTRFELSREQAESRHARLDLGAFYFSDISYVNGREVGRTDYQYPPRRYLLPPGLLRAGENEILVRLLVPHGTGGAVAGKFYGLVLDEMTFPLGGDVWEIAKGPELPELPPPHFWRSLASVNYYAYIKPMQSFPFTAALWYQGESNDINPEDYAERFPRLIRRFRQDFGAKLPFIYVQLTRYEGVYHEMPEYSWAIIREAQRQALGLPHTAMVVSLDVGEANDLHPQDKWSLGLRAYLAYRALRNGRSGQGLSPELSSWFHTADKLRLYFLFAGSGLWADGEIKKAFVYQDPEGKTEPAEILEINENYLDLALPRGCSAEDLKQYKLLFLFKNNPPYAYLRNGEGLPASPFLLDLSEDGTA